MPTRPSRRPPPRPSRQPRPPPPPRRPSCRPPPPWPQLSLLPQLSRPRPRRRRAAAASTVRLCQEHTRRHRGCLTARLSHRPPLLVQEASGEVEA